MTPNIKPITDPLDKIAHRGHGFSKVYDDFLSLSVHALAKQEDEYMAITNRYPNDRPVGEREADLFAKAFGAWQSQLALEYRDYLGEIYESRVSLGENGQFFTPEALCELMAQMSGQKLEDGQRVYDPACGSGRTLLAATRLNRMATFHGVDLDHRCVKMTALNMLCRNVSGEVIWGNTLSLDAFGGYEFRQTPTGGTLEWFGENRAKHLLTACLSHGTEGEKVEQPIEDEKLKAEREQYSLGL